MISKLPLISNAGHAARPRCVLSRLTCGRCANILRADRHRIPRFCGLAHKGHAVIVWNIQPLVMTIARPRSPCPASKKRFSKWARLSAQRPPEPKRPSRDPGSTIPSTGTDLLGGIGSPVFTVAPPEYRQNRAIVENGYESNQHACGLDVGPYDGESRDLPNPSMEEPCKTRGTFLRPTMT